MSDRVIRWGILGCGDVCEVKAGPAFQKATNSALVAVMRRDAAKAADFATRHNVPKWYDDADELIADKDIDAVYIATPPSSHLPLALKVAAAGKPCLVEKPMALNARECRQVIEEFEKASVPLFVAYYRRALPAFVRVKAIVETQVGQVSSMGIRFGRPMAKDAGWRTDPAVSGGGLFVDLACHALNAMEWIVGTPFVEPQGFARSLSGGAVEEVVVLNWSAGAGGVPGYAIYNFNSAIGEDVMEITGDAARVSWACFGAGTITITHAGGRIETERHPPPRHVHQPFVQTVVDELLGKGKCPGDARSAMRTSELMDAALVDFY